MKKNWLMFFAALLSVGFISCSKNDEIAERNEEELFKEFVGEWTYSAEIIFDGVKSEIQGKIIYNADKTVEVVQSHYKDGDLYSEGEFDGICFITMTENYYELNTEIDGNVIPFDNIRFGYDGKYMMENNSKKYCCTFNRGSGAISIVENSINMMSKIELTKYK